MNASSKWIVLKFGGTSVSSRNNWLQIAAIAKKRLDEDYKVLIVHSALSQVSNLLEQAIDQALNGEQQPVLAALRARHQQLADDLDVPLPQTVEQSLRQLQQTLQGVHLLQECPARVRANILAQGELMATAIGAAFLQLLPEFAEQADIWLDARNALKAQHNPVERRHYLQAQCNYQPDPQVNQLLEASGARIRLTQGFICADQAGETCVLGRGGSDTSAAYFAAILQAQRLEIWTDVPGLFSYNPNQNPLAQRIKVLDYSEAQEMASQGAKVLHPCCIEPTQALQIPIHVFATDRPDSGSSCIQQTTFGLGQVKSIVQRDQVSLIRIDSLGMWHQVGFLSSVFGCINEIGVSIDLVATSQSSVSFTLDGNSGNASVELLNQLSQALAAYGEVSIATDCSVISLIGRGINQALPRLSNALNKHNNTQVKLLSQSSNDLNISLVVAQQEASSFAETIHQHMILDADGNGIFDISWQQLLNQTSVPIENQSLPWWQEHQQQLENIGHEFGTAYVYHLAGVAQQANKIKSLRQVDRAFYAIKANNHPQVLQTIEAQGLGFECVSPNELKLVLALFPQIDKQRIIFSPNFAPIADYQFALDLGVHVNIDNLFLLQRWPEVFKGKQIILRMDLGQGRGHHDHVRTAGVNSKFGIPISDLEPLLALIEQVGCQVVGLHSHSGSGILDPENWRQTAIQLCQLAQHFAAVRYIDLGGGLGIVDKNHQQPLDLQRLDASLAEVKHLYRQYEFWLEPGRYLVAEQGVLLAQVTQTKGKGQYQYVGVEAGMNALIRPALYGAYHPIFNLSKLELDHTIQATIVGPICESGDKLGVDRALPETEPNDVILIDNAGAYGATMASDYNLRGKIKELGL